MFRKSFFVWVLAVAPVAAQPVPINPPTEDAPVAEAAETAAAPDPREAETNALLEAGEWRKALKLSKRWIRDDKKSATAWISAGRAYVQAGKHKKAIRRFNKALKHHPHDANAYYWKGKAHEARGKWDEAANEYKAAVLSDPDMTDAKTALDAATARIAEAAGAVPDVP